jgi:hypothetical protein
VGKFVDLCKLAHKMCRWQWTLQQMIYHRITAAVSWLAVIVVRSEGVFAVAAGVLPDNANLLTCPDTEPRTGEICTTPTPEGSSCDYGKICCPGEGGDCIAKLGVFVTLLGISSFGIVEVAAEMGSYRAHLFVPSSHPPEVNGVE